MADILSSVGKGLLFEGLPDRLAAVARLPALYALNLCCRKPPVPPGRADHLDFAALRPAPQRDWAASFNEKKVSDMATELTGSEHLLHYKFYTCSSSNVTFCIVLTTYDQN